ncbi:MAG: hypothetical protein KGI27_07665 [Thaumarchaeota archaeon]|nr:hypothetical protein [Nitrososphaerota archaeon]
MKRNLLSIGIITGVVIASIFFFYMLGVIQPHITSEPHHFVAYANDTVSPSDKP